MKYYSGQILSGDVTVAAIKDNVVIDFDKQKAPFMIEKGASFFNWVVSRAADNTRFNVRLLKKALGLTDKSDFETVLHFNAATITDNFWFKENGSDLTWKDVRFIDNKFDKVALIGDPTAFLIPYSRTPELTNIGSFDKCWKKEDNVWYLYKKENIEERFCECFISEIGSKIYKFNMAEYKLTNNGIKTRDFTENNKYNLEHLASLIGDDDSYNTCFNCLYKIDSSLALDYLKIIYLDTICLNYDRHNVNCGILRNPISGSIEKLAPNYDNNIALVVNGVYPSIQNTGFDKMFLNFLMENKDASYLMARIDLHDLNKKELELISNDFDLPVNKERINDYLVAHSSSLNKQIRNIIQQNKDYEYKR